MFASLGPKVKASYKKAVASGAVIFSASETEDVDEETTLGIPVSCSSQLLPPSS
jgi:hypothetical protein